MPEGETTLVRRTKKVVRFSRRVVLGAVLAASLGLLWLNYVGLPNFLRRWVLTELNRKNFDLQVAHVRMEGFSSVLVEQVRFKPSAEGKMPTLNIHQGEILFDPAALLRFQLVLRGLNVQEGRLDLAVEEGQPPFTVSNVRAELLFLPEDTWTITQFSGQSLGVDVALSATITNASALAAQRQLPEGGAGDWRRALADFAHFARRLDLPSPPRLSLKVYGDARDSTSFRASARLSARNLGLGDGSLGALDATMYLLPGGPGVKTYSIGRLSGWSWPGNHLAQISVSGTTEWTGSDSNRLAGASWQVQALGLGASWGRVDEINVDLTSAPQESGLPFATRVRGTSTPIWTEAGESGPAGFQAQFDHAAPLPSLPRLLADWVGVEEIESSDDREFHGQWSFAVENLITPHGRTAALRLDGEARPHPGTPALDPSIGWWNRLRHVDMPFSLSLTNVEAGNFACESVTAGFHWRYPDLSLTNLHSSLYRGQMTGTAHLDVQTRKLTCSTDCAFDYRQLGGWFGGAAQKWLAQSDWPAAPRLEVTASVELPSWTNSWQNAASEIQQTAAVQGRLQGGAMVRGLEIVDLAAVFAYSNSLVRLDDARFELPGGSVGFTVAANLTNREFSGSVASELNPAAFAPWLDEKGLKVLDFVQFQEVPHLKGQISGHWDRPETIVFAGNLAATNIVVRGETVADISTRLRYSNLVLECENVVVHRVPQEVATVPYARVDIPNEVMFVTNGWSNCDPFYVTRMIGPQTHKAIQPFRFATPPRVRINGHVPLRHYSKADLYFDLEEGRDFTYWRFRLPRVTGNIHWKFDDLTLTNVQVDFYGGKAQWEGAFKFDPNDDADFSFRSRFQGAALQPLVADLFQTTNHMEGTLSGELTITSARTDDLQSWNGYGSVKLYDGFLWSIPLFGIFSPLLDSITPGWGSSRITAGTADFTITNTVVHTANMEARAAAFRLKYRGTVDLDGRLDALAEAMFLRDAWLVGRVFSLALWPVSKAFEARVTGTLQEPKSRLRYMPQFLTAPFRMLNRLGRPPRSAPAEPGEVAPIPPPQNPADAPP